MSNEKEEKIYVGGGKAGNYETVRINVCLDDCNVYADKNIENFNGKKYISLDVKPKREVDQYGKSHSVSINTWKPNQEPEKEEYVPQDGQPISGEQTSFDASDNIPF